MELPGRINPAPKELIDKLAASAATAPLPVYDATPDPTLAYLKEINLRDHLAKYEGLVFNSRGACLCPVHAEKEPSFEVKRHTDGHWYWFDWHNQGRAGFSGTIIDYYVVIKGLSVGEAIAKIKELEGIREPVIGPTLKTPDPIIGKTPAITANDHGTRKEKIKLDARPLSAFKSRETHYLMYERIPMGMFTLLYGGGGMGKSTFLNEIACRVSRGDPLPGALKALVPAGSIIYITTENQPEEVFRPRTIACGGDLTKIIYVRNVLTSLENESDGIQVFNLCRHMNALSEYVRERGDVRGIFVDPAISHVDEKIDDGRAKPVRQLIDSLSDFAEQKKVAFVGVDHVTKALATSAKNKAAGSHQWTDAARVAIACAADPADLEKQRHFLSVMKANITVNWKTLAFNIVKVPVIDEESPELSLQAVKVTFETEELDIDVESLFNPDKLTESMTSKAIRLFNNELKNGPRPSDEIWALAESLGIGEGPYKYARRKRDIHAEKLGGKFGTENEEKWVLWLPEHWDAHRGTKGG